MKWGWGGGGGVNKVSAPTPDNKYNKNNLAGNFEISVFYKWGGRSFKNRQKCVITLNAEFDTEYLVC